MRISRREALGNGGDGRDYTVPDPDVGVTQHWRNLFCDRKENMLAEEAQLTESRHRVERLVNYYFIVLCMKVKEC